MTVENIEPGLQGGARQSAFWRDPRLAFAVKWVASVIQIAGYAATAFGLTPLNLYLFLGGVVGWLAMGLLWNDRAIMLIHLVALGAMLAGMASG